MRHFSFCPLDGSRQLLARPRWLERSFPFFSRRSISFRPRRAPVVFIKFVYDMMMYCVNLSTVAPSQKLCVLLVAPQESPAVPNHEVLRRFGCCCCSVPPCPRQRSVSARLQRHLSG